MRSKNRIEELSLHNISSFKPSFLPVVLYYAAAWLSVRPRTPGPGRKSNSCNEIVSSVMLCTRLRITSLILSSVQTI